jgi:hypothetical protein
MNMDKLNHWLTLAANIGVIAGIVFLGIELQQNTSMMRAQTRDSMTEKVTNWQMNVSSNPFTAITFTKGYYTEVLERETGEMAAWNMLALSNLRLWENEYYQYKAGLFNESEFTPRLDNMKNNMHSSIGMQKVWSEQRAFFSPEFRDLLDSYIPESVLSTD